MSTLFGLYPFLLKLYADGGYQGAQFQQGLKQVCRQVTTCSPRIRRFQVKMLIDQPAQKPSSQIPETVIYTFQETRI